MVDFHLPTPKKPVCRPDCADRSATCHATCEKYLAWKREVDEARERRLEDERTRSRLSNHERSKMRRQK